MERRNEMKIFWVDDDQFSLNMYRQHLANKGYSNITTFGNGTECLNALTQMPELIFLDHSMEILTGLEVLKKIKRFNPDIYVVFISGQDDLETAVNSLKFGAFDYIVKGQNDLARISQVVEKVQEVKTLLKKHKKNLLSTIFSLF